MCGILGYAGGREAAELLLEGLRRLEYRGYDSAGLCLVDGSGLQIRKCAGRIDNLAALVGREPVHGTTGISHTRWATHGEPTDANAHPHLDRSGKLALVHNGVIENYLELKRRLSDTGHTFSSQTDTEVLAHLIGDHYDRLPATRDRLLTAVRNALVEVTGTYGIAVVHADHPGEIVGARRGSPLVIGIGDGEFLLSSDVTALVAHTRDVIYLNDHDLVWIEGGSYQLTSLTQPQIDREVRKIEWDSSAAQRGEFAHFMLKEIFEQPASLENVMRGRLDWENCSAKLGGLNMTPRELREIDRILIVACGTALHAAMAAEYVIEELAHIPVEVDFASEARYRNSPLDARTLVLVVSQSGETADTLAAMREAQRKGLRALAICNVVGSTIARESDGGVYMHAGPEIGVAATKSFTSQLAIFVLLGLLLGRLRHLACPAGRDILDALKRLPGHVGEILDHSDAIRATANRYAGARDMLFLGRQANYPIALEGALKLKEISYIHAEAYPSAEIKHGVIALISPEFPTVIICPRDGVYEKNLSNLQEIKARKGPVIAIAHPDDTTAASMADDVLPVPETHPIVQPILNVVPLQLFAYHTAVALGRDVDKPRNLAKSVTVE
ncbi:MAG TPA: glutamine--fructose-6-phosphate transaminase (isomerizing) [Verrucomicrobiae bacterium]|nr:glutamine--fructose-6-phosphate transaminase (isomerizing) [Verrucomicrobiae bacterium]